MKIAYLQNPEAPALASLIELAEYHHLNLLEFTHMSRDYVLILVPDNCHKIPSNMLRVTHGDFSAVDTVIYDVAERALNAAYLPLRPFEYYGATMSIFGTIVNTADMDYTTLSKLLEPSEHISAEGHADIATDTMLTYCKELKDTLRT